MQETPNSLQLHLDENELVRVRVHHVVLDPGVPGIGLARRQLGHDLPVRGLLHQLARGQHDHDVVVRMPVPAGLRPRRKAPFSHDRAVGLCEEFWGVAWGREVICSVLRDPDDVESG